MWGRALRLSAPTPQVYNITHSVGLRQPGATGCRLGRGAKYWSPCSLKFTPAAAHAEPGRGRSQEKLLLIQLAALQLVPEELLAETRQQTQTHTRNHSAKKAPSSIQPQPKVAEDKKENKHRVILCMWRCHAPAGYGAISLSAMGRQARNIPQVCRARAQKV